MKILRNKNLFGCLFAVLLAFPMLNILSRSAYAVVNKNAYQSFSGENSVITNIDYQYKYQSNTVDTLGDLVIGNVYRFTINNDSLDGYVPWDEEFYLYFDILYTYSTNFDNYSFSVSDTFTATNNSSEVNVFMDLTWDSSHVGFMFGNEPFVTNVFEMPDMEFTLDCIILLKQYRFSDTTMSNNFLFYTDYNEIVSATANVVVDDSGTLDNVFEYSIRQFTNDNNFGQLDFFGWFSGMFLADNSKNNLYINFINWYLNYALLISVAYILFLCLMWFINFVRRLLDKGMNFGDRGY